MKFYYAPMESITGYPLRNTHHAFFPGIDKYYTPFLSANEAGRFTGREGRDVDPANNTGINVVPQILTGNPEHFVWAVEAMEQRGYREVNFNLGCPSGTVVAKGKGSGFLRDPDRLNDFLEASFTEIEKLRLTPEISIKTRLGIQDPGEALEIIRIYNQYPISELTIHPRVQKDMYRNPVNLDAFLAMALKSKAPVVYNGDINSASDYQHIMSYLKDRGFTPEAVMLGRGLVRNPALVREINGGKRITKEEVSQYVRTLRLSYEKEIPGEKNVLFKMKENWNYLGTLFPGSDRYLKEIRKAKTRAEYLSSVNVLLSNCDIACEVKK